MNTLINYSFAWSVPIHNVGYPNIKKPTYTIRNNKILIRSKFYLFSSTFLKKVALVRPLLYFRLFYLRKYWLQSDNVATHAQSFSPFISCNLERSNLPSFTSDKIKPLFFHLCQKGISLLFWSIKPALVRLLPFHYFQLILLFFA